MHWASASGILPPLLLKEPGQYSWQLMNWKIAIKELAVSGCDYMTAFRHKRKLELLKHLLFGNRELVNRLIKECSQDIVVAQSLPELVDKMNENNLEGLKTDLATVSIRKLMTLQPCH